MGFASQNFEALKVSFPYNGMNQDITPQLLPEDQAWYLENFTQDSLGNGTLRYGTKAFTTLSGVEDGFVMRGFPFIAQGGVEQILCYMNVLMKDTVAQNIQLNGNKIEFSSTNGHRYLNDTWIRVRYVDLEGYAIDTNLAVANVMNNNNTISLTVPEVILPDVRAVSISFSEGQLFCLDVKTKTATQVYDKLRVDGIPRAVPFVEKLVICNGLDPLLEWNGQVMQVVSQWVKEQADQLTKVSDTQLSFRCTLNPDKYTTAKSLFFNAQEVQLQSQVVNGQLVTLTFNTPIGQVPTQIFYKAYPPRCNFLYVAQDRLWGLGQGQAGLASRSPEEAMKIYRCDRPNLTNSWIEEQTQTYHTLDLSNKHGVVDNLEAIAQMGSRIVFIGREKTQVYGGLVANNTFGWQSTVSTGAIHGDLVFELANDIFFINAAGLHSFSTLNIGNQFAATSLTRINVLLKQQVVKALQSNIRYRKSFVFIYNLGAFLGIRIGESVINHALFATQPSFFSIFSGDFEADHIFTLGNRLYLMKDKAVLIYGDGRDGNLKVYDDRGHAIVGAWHQPFAQHRREMFSCQRVSCLADYSNVFTDHSENGVFIELFHERPKATTVRKQAILQPRKELIKLDPNRKGEDLDNDIEFEGKFKTLIRELKKRGVEPWLYVSVISKGSPFSIRQVIFYGRRDR